MREKTIINIKTRTIVVIILSILLVFISYKIYAPYSIRDFNAVNHENLEKIRNEVKNDTFSFTVVGNIKNSIVIFDKRILPRLREKEPPEFIISTGNNVVASGEGKYRVLNRTLQRLQIPFLTAVGVNEVQDGGYRNFYKYFGPFYYSFSVGDSYFIFLDTTGHSSFEWQKEWLEKQLHQARNYSNKFVIMNKPPVKLKETGDLLRDRPPYITDSRERDYFQQIFARENIEAVFSSNAQIYKRKNIDGIDYFISGGAGGRLSLDNPRSFYHFIQVEVNSRAVNYDLIKIEDNISHLTKFFFSLWVISQSFLYTNYISLILILLVVLLVSFIVVRELTREVDYYRNFQDVDKLDQDQPLTIAMFTNTYFPVIGGVAISVSRLARGLRKQGHTVYIFAPDYPGRDYPEEENVIRCKLLYYFSKENFPMPITNIFSQEIDQTFEKIDFDLVHAHHPFWMGKKAQKLGEEKDLPVVFTYHTRLEKYAHYIPGFWFIRKLFINRFSHWMIKRFSNKCQAVFAPTESARQYLRNIGVRTPVEVLSTGVDFDDYDFSEEELDKFKRQYVAEGENLLISVSRLSREKNLYFLLDGLREIKKRTECSFKCLLVGEGPEEDNIKKYISKHGLEENVELVGGVNHRKMGKYYRAADLFVFASTTETQGMVLLEAMAGRTPVVAVKSSGVDDVVENGYNGFKTAEDTRSWSQEVIRLLENQQLLSRTADNAYELARKYSVKNMAARAEKIYYRTKENMNKE